MLNLIQKKSSVAVGVVVLIVALFFIMRGGGNGNVTLTAQTDKESYSAGEAINLTLSLTNAGEKNTCIGEAAGGSVRFASVTRDGGAVAERTAPSYYIESLSELVKIMLVSIAPGESIDIALTSYVDPGLGSAALRTTELDETSGFTTFYDVGTPGAYEIEVAYKYRGEASEACPDVFKGSTNAATVSFIVTQ